MKNICEWLLLNFALTQFRPMSISVDIKSKISLKWVKPRFQADTYLPKVNYRSIGTRCEVCLKSTIKTSGRWHWCRPGVFIVNFEHISHLILVLLLLPLSRLMPALGHFQYLDLRRLYFKSSKEILAQSCTYY